MKQKIVINTNKYLPYSETFIQNHIEGLNHYEAVVFASERSKNGLTPKCTNEYIIKDRLLGEITDRAYKLGVIPPAALKYLKNCEVKLIHSHFGQNGYAAIKLAKKLNVSLITTFHGADIVRDVVIPSDGRLLNKFTQDLTTLAENGDCFIAVSAFIKRKLIEKGFPAEKIRTNYIGIDRDKFQLDKRIIRQKSIVCVARHVKYKGIDILINAMQKINVSKPDWKLILVGDGPETEKLKHHALKSNANVEFLGRLKPHQVKDILSRSSIYCQSSIKLDNGHEEALALTIIEAQAMGLPAVVFDSGGMPEAININKSGFVAKAGCALDLSNKLLKLIESEPMRRDFSSEAIKFVSKKHCLKTQTRKLESIYSEFIK